MNYYSHHIGDYTTDTAHLSLLEDGAYRRLMDRYYTTEAPLPADEAALFRVVRARAPDEQEAVRVVLAEFFDLTDAGWTHKRCDAEISAFKAKSGKAAEAANKRWSKPVDASALPVADANAMPTQCERIADAMPTNNQEPITKNQEPGKSKAKAAPKARKPAKTFMPDDFAISPAVQAWASAKGHADLQAHFESFVRKAKANGYTYVDWDQALQNAVIDDWAKLRTPTARAGPAAMPAKFDPVAYVNRNRIPP
ncbi:hypothetical protein BN2497_10485 [Janthinobacterium sp. CG23_2]|nr:hypothetical protein BN2497_2577 [Janthinobacterium sp. CG23_2]CUI07854.1 hypothetical protein BN2497_10485 [Janthinobacterium sp. CG23_2]CUU27686.1 hypothetical protein BN3177_2577 [Janthinobacterium sp. CG23_2]CUU31640.1 hypothetical protein BN3177_10485 [Janthinobacterium sp. CG23_2]